MWQLSVLNARFGITNKRSRRSPKVPPLMISKLNFGTTAVVFKTSNLGGTYRNNDPVQMLIDYIYTISRDVSKVERKAMPDQ